MVSLLMEEAHTGENDLSKGTQQLVDVGDLLCYTVQHWREPVVILVLETEHIHIASVRVQ
jgi:hypothetical protein